MIRRWLRLPPFPTELAGYNAARLGTVMAGTYVVVTAAMVLLMALEPSSVWRRSGTLLAVTILFGGMHELNRRGRTQLAGWILMFGLVTIVTQRAWITGGIYAPVLPLYLVFVLMGGMLLSSAGRYAMTLASLAGLTLLALGQFVGWVTPTREFAPPAAMLIFGAMVLGISLVLQTMIRQRFQATIARLEQEARDRQAAETTLRLALDAGQIGVWELDPATSRFRADARLFEIYGLPAPTDREVPMGEWKEHVHPEDRDFVGAEIQRVLERGPNKRIEFRAARLDGTTRYVLGAAVHVAGDDGGAGRVIGMNVDITQRKLAELDRERLLHNLGERVKELRLLHHVAQAMQRPVASEAELLQDIVVSMPEAWQYPEVTAARITLGETSVATQAWRETEWMQSTHFTSGDRTGTITVAYTELRPDADEGPFLDEERALLDSVAEMIVAHVDSMRSRHELEVLVARRTAELQAASESLSASLAKLQELEGLRDDLVKMIVHDMRGLLLVVLANLELARVEVEGQPKSDIDDAMGAAQEVNKMANTLLDVSRLEEGKMPITLAPCDLAALSGTAAVALRALDATRTIEVSPSPPVFATCDAGLMRRVLDNLIGNAIKHTPEGGRVRVQAERAGVRVRVAVQDDGPGVPAERLPRIFDKFGWTKPGGTKTMHSAGLGLAFCKLAVEAHGGSIAVANASPRGAVFTIELPG
jgi:PAS domain S-box-containing protein